MQITDPWDPLSVLARVGAAMLLGALVGAERWLRGKPAGLRTQMLVAGAACFFVLLGDKLMAEVGRGVPEAIRTDPLRILGGVVAGISFLGAGTIIHHGREESIEGLTTAASMLFTAAIGIAVALSELLTAAGATVMVIAVLSGLGAIEGRVEARRRRARESGPLL